ncbi:MAG: PTS transporter subunit EIIC [Rhodoglobus sp.]
MSDYTPTVTGTGVRAGIQRFGGFLAGMIMPNIGAFIAWGLITALFIPTGWIPNETIATLVGPIILYLLPILIGFTGGRLVYGQRGGVVGALVTVGVVVGTTTPQFLGAMIVGPLAALILKYIEKLWDEKIRPGFEMLVNNFSLGILGGALAIGAFFVMSPILIAITNVLGGGVGFMVDSGLLPLASILIEPAKVLFLNNAINHGVLGPLAVIDVQEAGKSILFMLESNPGPGLGILLAFFFFGPRAIRPSVPGAIIIHFFGGIHEIYFPYVLMKPQLILAAIIGGATGITMFLITGVGLVASPSPGSIIAYTLVAAPGDLFLIYLGIVLSAAASFFVGMILFGFGRKERLTDEEKDAADQALLEESMAKSAANKANK